jgi:hypothetical protein
VVIPGVTGAGALVRALTHVDDAVDAVKAVGRVGDVVDAVRTAENAGDAVQAANQANRLSDAANVVGDFCSFTADMPVATSEGQQSITQIDEGDQVLAYNETTGVTEYYTVTAVLEHIDLLEVRLHHPGRADRHHAGASVLCGRLWLGTCRGAVGGSRNQPGSCRKGEGNASFRRIRAAADV